MRTVTAYQVQFMGLDDFPARMGEQEIVSFFTFAQDDLDAISAKYKEQYRIPAALQIGFIRMTGRTLTKVPTRLSRDLLQYLGEQLGVEAPDIATLKTLYKSERTLFRHQNWHIARAGFEKQKKAQMGQLKVYMKKEASYKAEVDLLIESGFVWLAQHGILNTGPSLLLTMARDVVSSSMDALYSMIVNAATPARLARWEQQLLLTMPNLGITHMEWLCLPPRRMSLRTIKDRINRIDFLRNLEVDAFYLKDVPLEKIKLYANEMRRMKPAKFKQLQDEKLRTIRLACFMRHSLTEITDDTVALCHRHIWDIWTTCEKKAKEKDAELAIGQRSLLNEIFKQVDSDMSDAEFRALVRELKASDKAPKHATRKDAARFLMTEPGSPVRALLKQVQRLDLKYIMESPADGLMTTVKGLYGRDAKQLDSDTYIKSRAWKSLLEGPDRERALRALEAHTLLTVRKGLRCGDVYIDSSGAFRNRDELLIPKNEWGANRKQYYEDLGLPMDAWDYLERLVIELRKKLEKVAAAIDKGTLPIEDGKIPINRLKAEKHPTAWKQARDALEDAIPKAQLPDIILEIDSRAGFSRALLNRPARSEQELLQLYAGMLAHATGLDATTVALMLPGVKASEVQAGMLIFEDEVAVRAANDAVVAYHRKFPVTKAWGDGTIASSDMMAVDVSPKVVRSRKDYRRKVSSVGVYTHVLDQWIIFHDHPIMLNERQAGIALEGVVRHREIGVDMLAVDTHGYTEFGMCMGALLKVALCPRIKKLKERKLHCPSNIRIPKQIEPVSTREVKMNAIREYWDDLVRVAASIEKGTVSATIALARFGTSAQGDPVYHAGMCLGRMIRSLFLCDFFLDEDFRRVVNGQLAHGEAVHNLQRAIYTGTFSKPRGDRDENLIALSGSMTLITNICMAWTTSRIQAAMNDRKDKMPPWLKIVSPARTAHINFRGTLKFSIDAYADRLIRRRSQRAA